MSAATRILVVTIATVFCFAAPAAAKSAKSAKRGKAVKAHKRGKKKVDIDDLFGSVIKVGKRSKRRRVKRRAKRRRVLRVGRGVRVNRGIATSLPSTKVERTIRILDARPPKKAKKRRRGKRPRILFRFHKNSR